jgi:hypothetical protein
MVRTGTGLRSSDTARAYPGRYCSSGMGQLITVTRKPSIRPDVAIFELNRSLTGMGHERYHSVADIVRHRPVDELARRLFEAGGIEAVHVYSNMVTLDLAAGAKPTGLEDIISGLFTYYREGVEVAEPTG